MVIKSTLSSFCAESVVVNGENIEALPKGGEQELRWIPCISDNCEGLRRERKKLKEEGVGIGRKGHKGHC